MLKVKSNTMTIGWLITIIFSLIAIISIDYVINSIILINFRPDADSIMEIENNSNYQSELIKNLITLIASLTFAYAGYSLTKFKKWSIYVVNLISLLIIGVTFFFIWQRTSQMINTSEEYLIDHFGQERASFQLIGTRYRAISLGTFGLILTWLIAKVNLLFYRSDYKALFKK